MQFKFSAVSKNYLQSREVRRLQSKKALLSCVACV